MTETKIFLPSIADGEDKSSPLKNRIRKNYRHVRKWAKRTETNCFRIYDREIPHYALGIDFYDGKFCVQHFSRTRDTEDPPHALVEEVNDTLCSLFESDPEAIYWRTRIKREKMQQYEKIGKSKEFFTVLEHGLKFKINLLDYLDTGLFLDHRETRKLVAPLAKGKHVLNLFAYTCSFSIYAAAAGALFTKSVDMSNTYNAWGKENFILNSIPLKNNVIIRADCLKFLDQEIQSGAKYDLIIIDPPTISRSKKMEQMFDIQEDYIFLIEKSLKLLSQDGVIFFSTNSRKFVFDTSHFTSCSIIDISHKTIPLDFHKARIHRCWKIYQNEFKSWSFGNAGALKLDQAKPQAKQRVCRHTCDAAGFKVRDASAAKNQILSSFRYTPVLGINMIEGFIFPRAEDSPEKADMPLGEVDPSKIAIIQT